MSNTPSEELRLLLQEARSALWQPANAELCERIDDALARLGTLQPVVQEPFCYVSVNKQGDITRVLKRKDKWTNIPLYTAPQPAQVQPVVLEPLSDEQIAEMMREAWGCASIAPRHAMMFARAIEHAHGITGGQHGD